MTVNPFFDLQEVEWMGKMPNHMKDSPPKKRLKNKKTIWEKVDNDHFWRVKVNSRRFSLKLFDLKLDETCNLFRWYIVKYQRLKSYYTIG